MNVAAEAAGVSQASDACGLPVLSSSIHAATAAGAWSREKNTPPAQCASDIQQLVPHLVEKRLDVTVLHGLPRRDVVPPDPRILRPGEDGKRGEPGSGVTDNQAGPASPFDESRELPRHPVAGDRAIREGGQARVGDAVDDVEDPEPPAVRHLVIDEVQGPFRGRSTIFSVLRYVIDCSMQGGIALFMRARQRRADFIPAQKCPFKT